MPLPDADQCAEFSQLCAEQSGDPPFNAADICSALWAIAGHLADLCSRFDWIEDDDEFPAGKH